MFLGSPLKQKKFSPSTSKEQFIGHAERLFHFIKIITLLRVVLVLYTRSILPKVKLLIFHFPVMKKDLIKMQLLEN